MGNSLWEQTTFNNRLQATAIKLGTTAGGSQRFSLGLDYGTTSNNGNLRSQAINTISATQYYAYDSLNRLKAAAENPGDSQPNCPSAQGSTWCEAYGYDRYGNRWVSYSSGIAQSSLLTPTSAAWFNSANNRFAATYGSYDLAGNLTGMAGWSFQYDGGNHQKQASINGWAGSVFTYVNGPDGRRVSKSVYGNTDVYVYDAFGQLAAEYQNGALLKEFVYLNGKLLAVELAAWRGRPASTEYVTTDHLGSARVLTSATGAVLSRHDYLPFGKETPLGGARTSAGGYISPEQERVLQRFTGDELDPETGLGYFINRYYSGRQGRFTSPDPLGVDSADLTNPQSLNGYAYMLGNPLLYTDQLGLGFYRIDCEQAKIPVSGYEGWMFVPGLICHVVVVGPETPPVPPTPPNVVGGGPSTVSATTPLKEFEQKQLDKLQTCLIQIYNVSLRAFTPVMPGSNGYFYARTSAGRQIAIETNVTHSSVNLGLTIYPLSGPVAGRTPLSTSPNQVNFVASDQLVMAPGPVQPTQVHEIAHSLDLITSGSVTGSSEASADRLLSCILKK